MARYLGARLKKSRQYGSDLGLLSGVRSTESKCKLDTKPGMHGSRPGRTTEYGAQLKEKQKLKIMYGLMERQFRNLFKKAVRMKGATGEKLLQLLESRLDNVVYKLGFASTRAEARQLVSHRGIIVNDKIVNIPSYTLAAGDQIGVRERVKKQLRIQGALALAQAKPSCSWLEVDMNELKGVFKQIPDRSDLPSDINEKLIVELYSK